MKIRKYKDPKKWRQNISKSMKKIWQARKLNENLKTMLSNPDVFSMEVSPVSSQHEFDKIIEEARLLRCKKNNDYGDGFMESYNAYGNKALFFDMLRKWKRLEKILLEDKELMVADETLEDTLKDLSIMALNGILWLRRKKK